MVNFLKNQNKDSNELVSNQEKGSSLYKEIDFLLIVKTLWHEKITVLIVTGIFTLSAFFYANSVEEVWTSKAKILPPFMYDYAELQKQTAKLLPAFETVENVANSSVDNPFEAILEPKELLKNFINEFNSSDNKKAFLAGNEFLCDSF